MPYLSGDHTQAHTGRRFRYWVTFGPVSDEAVAFAAAISEPRHGPFGGLEHGSSFDGTVHPGPDCMPVELAIRAHVLGHIERTDFGAWQPPPPNWRGWYGLI